jgi:hypothetical protein
MRQFSIESLRSTVRRGQLRVVNASRPTTPTSVPGQRMSLVLSEDDESEYEMPFEQMEATLKWESPEVSQTQENGEKQPLKRYNSTNDSGYSSMNPDTASDTDESVDPLWWEEAAGYTTSPIEDQTPATPSAETFSTTQEDSLFSAIRPHSRTISLSTSVLSASTSSSKTRVISTKLVETSDPDAETLQYLYSQRQESFQLSTLLRNYPTDEWTEWREKVTNLLMIPEEDGPDLQKPLPPVPHTPPPSTPIPREQPEQTRSPTRRRSFFNFAKVSKIGISKRKSVLW